MKTLKHLKTELLLRLSVIEPKNDREKELKNHLLVKIYNLRSRDIPNLVFLLAQIENEKDVSDEFKRLCFDILRTLEKHKKQLLEEE